MSYINRRKSAYDMFIPILFLSADRRLALNDDYKNMSKELMFPREKLKIIRELGSGQFGLVLLAEADGVKLAVKTLKGNL